MKDSNKLFILATIIVFTVLLSINYNAISDYYKFALPLNTLVFEPSFYSYDPDEHYQSFLAYYNDENSECITTPNDNMFCYVKDLTDREGVFATTLVGDNGIDGEIHLDHVDEGKFYFIILDMKKNPDGSVDIIFNDRDYRMGVRDFPPIEDFDYSTTIEPFDAFVSHCHSKDGKTVTIVQYLGTTFVDGEEYFMTWHVPAKSEIGITCEYPKIIEYSLNQKFKEL